MTSKLSLLQALLNLCFSLIFIHQWGLVGVALASSVPSFVISSVMLPYFANRQIGISPLKFVTKSIVPSLVCSIIPLFTLLLIKAQGYGMSFFQLGTVCLLCAILFGIPYLIFFNRDILKFKT